MASEAGYVVFGAEVCCDCGATRSFLQSDSMRSEFGNGYIILHKDTSIIHNFTNNFGACTARRNKTNLCKPQFIDEWFGVQDNVQYDAIPSAKYMEQYLDAIKSCSDIIKAEFGHIASSREFPNGFLTNVYRSPDMASLKDAKNDIAIFEQVISILGKEKGVNSEELLKATDQLKNAQEILSKITAQSLKSNTYQGLHPLTIESVLICKNGGVVSITDPGQKNYLKSLTQNMKGRFLPDKGGPSSTYKQTWVNGTVLQKGANSDLIRDLHIVLNGLIQTGKLMHQEGLHFDYTTSTFGEPTEKLIKQYIQNASPIITDKGYEAKLESKASASCFVVDTPVWESLGLPTGKYLSDLFVIPKPTKKDYFISVKVKGNQGDQGDEVHITYSPKFVVYECIEVSGEKYDILRKPGSPVFTEYVTMVLGGLKQWEVLITDKIHGRNAIVKLHLVDKSGQEWTSGSSVDGFAGSDFNHNFKIYKDRAKQSMAMESVVWSRNRQVGIRVSDTYPDGTNPIRGLWYNKTTRQFDIKKVNSSYFKNICKHEFGHVLGLWDAYSYKDHWSLFPDFGEWLVPDATAITGQNSVMANNSHVSSLEIEMVLWAWMQDTLQTYAGGALGSIKGEISQAFYHSLR